jgi:NADH-quinone oxidoreductase subunit H
MLELAPLIEAIDRWLTDVGQQMGLPPLLVEIVGILLAAIVIVAIIAVLVLVFVYAERKIAAHIQNRMGPMRVGWHGVLQTLADALKLLQKENIMPATADRWIWWWAPVLAFTAVFGAYVAVPFGEGLIVRDLNIGILYITAITTFGVISMLMAGWGSNNKYSLLGGFRSAAQVISYEVPLALAILSVVMVAGSLSMVSIVEAQSGYWLGFVPKWFIFRHFPFGLIGFVVFVIAGTAETNRTPFDLPEAESELVAGFATEYSGMKWAMFMFSEYGAMYIMASVGTVLFLGGWHGPVLPSWMWFAIKSLVLIFVLMWFRWTFPRLRVDQLMELSWKFLIPLAFVNLLAVGLWAVLS